MELLRTMGFQSFVLTQVILLDPELKLWLLQTALRVLCLLLRDLSIMSQSAVVQVWAPPAKLWFCSKQCSIKESITFSCALIGLYLQHYCCVVCDFKYSIILPETNWVWSKVMQGSPETCWFPLHDRKNLPKILSILIWMQKKNTIKKKFLYELHKIWN